LAKCAASGVPEGAAIALLKSALFETALKNPYKSPFSPQRRLKLIKNQQQPMKNLSKPMFDAQKSVTDASAKAIEEGNRVANMANPASEAGKGMIPKAAMERLLKISEADPNLQRATALFKDWLTTKKHVVRPGEVLAGIARRYGVPLEDVMKENNMVSVVGIRPGQQIKIPVQTDQTAKNGGKGTV